MMNVDEILKELDNLFISGNMEKVEAFLFEKYNEAVATGDGGAALTILNEQIGYYRVTTQYEKALETIENIRNIIIKTKPGLDTSPGFNCAFINFFFISNLFKLF